jgi:hypothetical protein
MYTGYLIKIMPFILSYLCHQFPLPEAAHCYWFLLFNILMLSILFDWHWVRLPKLTLNSPSQLLGMKKTLKNVKVSVHHGSHL